MSKKNFEIKSMVMFYRTTRFLLTFSKIFRINVLKKIKNIRMSNEMGNYLTIQSESHDPDGLWKKIAKDHKKQPLDSLPLDATLNKDKVSHFFKIIFGNCFSL